MRAAVTNEICTFGATVANQPTTYIVVVVRICSRSDDGLRCASGVASRSVYVSADIGGVSLSKLTLFAAADTHLPVMSINIRRAL